MYSDEFAHGVLGAGVRFAGLFTVGLAAGIAVCVLLTDRCGAGGAAFFLGLSAVVLNLVAMGLTKLGHFPINDQILKWSPSDPPAVWTILRARWSTLHLARTICALGSFALFLMSNVLRR